MIRIGVIFLVGLLLTGCDAHQIVAKKISGVDVNNIKVELVVSDKLTAYPIKIILCLIIIMLIKILMRRIYHKTL